jgi:hypothetical protein
MRLTFAPFSFLELGASRTVLFDGGGPYLRLSKYPSAIFPFANPGFGDNRAHPEERSDSLLGVDADLRLRNVDRYFLPSRDLRIYGEFYWDDTCGECGPSSGVGHWFASNLLPKGKTTGGVGGVHLLGFFGQEWLDWRFEYARTSPVSLNHGSVHERLLDARPRHLRLHRDGWSRLFRAAHRTGHPERDAGRRPRSGHHREHGREFPRSATEVARRRRRRVLSFWERYSLFAQYLVSDVKNRQFRAGDNGFEHLIRLELTRSFR